MNTSSVLVALLLCFTLVSAQTSLKLRVSSGSNKNWIAVQVIDAALSTSTVEIKQASSQLWVSMELQTTGSNVGYWTHSDWSKSTGFDLPLSFRFVGSNGFVVTMNNAISTFPGKAQFYDTRVQYTQGGIPSSTSTVAPPPAAATTRPTAAPTTKATTKPTVAATTKPTTKATVKPTSKPTTKATVKPTVKPSVAATTKPTVKPTAAPTTKATTAPSSGCNAPVKMLVPLYMYPGAQWDTVIASANKVETVAIINPSSGPGTSGPSGSFKTYMTKFDQAGIEMIGYVHTSYGARSISEVKKEIDEYASKFTSVVGIFLDEVSAKDSELPYYKELHEYIMDMPGWKYNVINPGAVPTSGYVNAATQIVSFESTSSKFAASSNPSYASCNNKDKFSLITYGASASGMRSVVDAARSKGYYGWVYVTADSYTKLPSFYAEMAQYIADGN